MAKKKSKPRNRPPAKKRPAVPYQLSEGAKVRETAADREYLKKVPKLLQMISNGYTTRKALKHLGICRQWFWRARKRCPKLAEDFKEAQLIGSEIYEDAAHQRAVFGVREPVFHEGVICGYKRKYSDTLLKLLLEASNPEKYSSKQTHRHEGEVQMRIAGMSRDDLRQLVAGRLEKIQNTLTTGETSE